MPFEIVGLDDSYTVLQECVSSAVALAWFRRYVATEDAGGWPCIEVYDRRGEESERIAVWCREE